MFFFKLYRFNKVKVKHNRESQ